jgi:hypothetical protein
LLFAGCASVPNKPLQLATPIEKGKNFDVGIIEFDERGQYWSQQQHDTVLDYVRKVATTQGATIIVFVHGWHHNAMPDDGNLASFHSVLSRIAALPEVGLRCVDDDATSHNRVIGIYVGWRGESITTTGLSYTTIWSRKRVAQRIGGRLHQSEERRALEGAERPQFENLLRDLDEIRTSANATARAKNNAFTSLIITGHSLGGGMLVAAMDRIVFHGAAKGSEIPRIGDVVVALNPAIEAEKYREFDLLARQPHGPQQAPVLVVIGSRGDSANRYLFTISRIPPTLLPMYWGDIGSSFFTVGFRRTMRTHTLDPSGQAPLQSEYPSGLSGNDTDTALFDMSKERLYGSMRLKPFSFRGQSAQPYSPFMTIYSSRDIIKNHNDIFSEPIQDFLLPFATAVHRKNILPLCAAPAMKTAAP